VIHTARLIALIPKFASIVEQAARRPVMPVMKHEAATVRALDAHHLADEQHVVAGAMARVVAALEPRDAAVDQRCVRPAEPKRYVREAIGMRA